MMSSRSGRTEGSGADTESGAVPPPGVEELLAILNHIPALVSLVDGDGRNRFANSASLEWFGWPPEQMRGRTVAQILGPDFPSFAPYLEGVQAGVQQVFETPRTDASGDIRISQTTYTPRWVADRLDGFFVLVTDVTDRVRAEAAAQESSERVAWLHERQRIAAGLNDIVVQSLYEAQRALADAVATDEPEPEASLDAAIDRLGGAINELRTVIENLNQGMKPSKLPSAIDQVLRKATTVLGFAPTLTYFGSLDAVPSAACPDVVAVVSEALANVAQHSGAGSVAVTISTLADEVRVQVRDDGNGGVVEHEHRSGLRDLRLRAEDFGGSFSVADNGPAGSVLEWSIPINGS